VCKTQVFPFGSVPLKTYLPDGDIDLTAFGSTWSDENLANEVRTVLESEELRRDAEFEVKDVQYIHAEVCHFNCFFLYVDLDLIYTLLSCCYGFLVMLIGYVPYTRSGNEVLVIHLHLIYPTAFLLSTKLFRHT
jgi:hypothetical protein